MKFLYQIHRIKLYKRPAKMFFTESSFTLSAQLAKFQEINFGKLSVGFCT